MTQKDREEYNLLTEKLDETQWAIDGECNDIDCDKYMYKDLLKKKYKPTLNHSYSCLKSLKREKDAILRLLSYKKFKKYRFKKCGVCGKILDKLNRKTITVCFNRPVEKGYHELKCHSVHKECRAKVKTPKGWKNL